ncbi:MAG: 23S rRNA pseudouridine(1911/1915/1917) synthase RluD [Pseudomonadales bacterium]
MATLIRQLIVPAEYAGQRLDKVAATLLDEFSRVEVSKWIKEGSLTLDGQIVLPKLKLKGGENLALDAERTQREAWQEAQAIELDIVYQDEDVLVINKPVGLVVHPGAGNPSGTLVNGLLHHKAELSSLPRAGIVHRLDKDTSGLMVVAGSPAAFTVLTAAVAERTMTRQYLAICEGRMISGQDIDLPIGRDPQSRTRQAVREDGKPAFTEVRVEERFRVHTLVRAKLQTGRTHQIRVHMAHVGHPLVGDTRYGAKRRLPAGGSEALTTRLRQFPRQALHARGLGFRHPISNEWLDFVVDLPPDMSELVELLRDDDKAT